MANIINIIPAIGNNPTSPFGLNRVPNTIDISVVRVPKKEVFIFNTLGDLVDSQIIIRVYNNLHNVVAEFRNGESIEIDNNSITWHILSSDVFGHPEGLYSYTININDETFVVGLIDFDLSMNRGGVQNILEYLIEDDDLRAVSENVDSTKLTINEELDVTGNTLFYSDVTFNSFVILPKYSNESEATSFAGDTLTEAMMYYDTTDKVAKTYNGSTWV